MNLEPFDWSIGISDILQWRACPARFVFGMKRHTQGAPPESWSPANAYGSAIHLAIKKVNEGASHQEAVQAAFAAFSNWLEPSDVSRLYEDLRVYEERDMLGVRTIAAERDMRIPLFVWRGHQIYFRFQIDRLYQRLDDETKFVLVDYKSSKWVRSADEVDEDLQLWSYNVGVHRIYPECEDLLQVYDQLSFGQEFTRKNDAQREEMERWLIAAVTALLEDEELAPKFTEFCPWCPLKMDCSVVQHELTHWAQARIAAIAPRNPKMKKDGTPGKQLGKPELDPARFDEYVDLLPDVRRARQVLEAFEEAVKAAMKEIPDTSLTELRSREAPRGYRKDVRSRRTFTPTALQKIYDELGADFFHMASLSAASIERHYGKGATDEIAAVMAFAERGAGYTIVEPIRE